MVNEISITGQTEEEISDELSMKRFDERFEREQMRKRNLATFVETIELPACIAIGEINAQDEYAVHHTDLQHIIVWAKTQRGVKAGITRVLNKAAAFTATR